MSKNFVITLIENSVFRSQLKAEHGLSLLFNINDEMILFDTGQSFSFIENAKVLNFNLSNVKKLVFSHNHYDHAGGIEQFLEINSELDIYIGKDFFVQKFSKSTGELRKISVDKSRFALSRQGQTHFVDSFVQLSDSIFLLNVSSFKKKHSLNNRGLFYQPDKTVVPDIFEDELVFLFIDDEKINIFTGCAHNGIIFILEAVVERFPKMKIATIMGGFHLVNKNKSQLKEVALKFNEFDIERVVVQHCSGLDAFAYFKSNLNCEVEYGFTGTQFNL